MRDAHMGRPLGTAAATLLFNKEINDCHYHRQQMHFQQIHFCLVVVDDDDDDDDYDDDYIYPSPAVENLYTNAKLFQSVFEFL